MLIKKYLKVLMVLVGLVIEFSYGIFQSEIGIPGNINFNLVFDLNMEVSNVVS